MTTHNRADDRWRGKVDANLEAIKEEVATLTKHMDTFVTTIHQDKERAHEGFDIRIRNLEAWQSRAIGFTMAISFFVSTSIAIMEYIVRR